jgi:hypothetical protein
MKTKFIIGLLMFSNCYIAFAQDNDKKVSIKVSGSGQTIDIAKQSALRSAIEQAFGTFISTNTEILNDNVIADQISSISSGYIQSYEMLNESQFPDGSWGVTLNAIVSISKLTSFSEAKGIAIEIKGGLFALNIKQQLLNEQSEIRAVADMVGLLHEPMQISFDYVINSGDPKSLDGESKNWQIPLEVTATCNKNIDFCANYCIKTLSALSLSSEEVTSYKNLNKAIFPIEINYNGIDKIFYLTKKSSIDILKTLTSQWEFYTRLFTVQTGMDESNGKGNGNIHKFKDYGYYQQSIKINFLTAGQQAAKFNWADELTLSQIEQMTGYKVKPRGVTSQFKYGGFVVFEKNGHGLVAAITDLPDEMHWYSAKTACDELTLNGYSDWYLPSKEDLNLVYVNLKKVGLGGFKDALYWSSTESGSDNAWYFYFENGAAVNFLSKNDINYTYVRAVRSF